MTNGFSFRTAALLMMVLGGTAAAQPVGSDDGLRVFKTANCMGCHKWSGTGGGGYGGAAANLRETKLDLEQIEYTIRCGRPTTGMPHFKPDAYADGGCYGMKAAGMNATQLPPEPDHPLREPDIKAVAAYVVANIKGKGDPDLAQCQAFFGSGTRVCDVYRTAAAGSGQTASTHPKVEAASDANAGK